MATPPAAARMGRPKGTVPRNYFLRDGRESSKTRDPALELRCPVCGAPAGTVCSVANGNVVKRPHSARQVAAGKGRRT